MAPLVVVVVGKHHRITTGQETPTFTKPIEIGQALIFEHVTNSGAVAELGNIGKPGVLAGTHRFPAQVYPFLDSIQRIVYPVQVATVIRGRHMLGSVNSVTFSTNRCK